MGYYDKGSYNPDEERQNARDRYLDLISRQRLQTQAMADKMRREQETKNEEMSYQQAGDMEASGIQKGATMGGAFGPYGALIGGAIGGIAGRTSGALEHGQKYGHWEGIKAGLDPRSGIKGLLGFGNAPAGAGTQVASQGAEAIREKRGANALAEMMAKRDAQRGADAMADTSGLGEKEPSMAEKGTMDPDARMRIEAGEEEEDIYEKFYRGM